jgi:hypothetical protein
MPRPKRIPGGYTANSLATILAGAFWGIAKVVTAFTLAHSVTLSVAAFGIVELPSRLTESAIAASVMVAAINNIYPVITRRLWVVAFVFGLVHGFGFASVLTEFGLPPTGNSSH